MSKVFGKNVRNSKIAISILAFFLLYAPFAKSQILPQNLQAILASAIKDHVFYLAGDELRGRATGSAGAESAAVYIARNLKKAGIKPAGDNGTFFQSVPMHGSKPLKSSQLTIYTQDGKINLALEKDYLLYKYGAQTFVPQPLKVVFVGYGIVAPEYDYNDYQTIDVRNKIVVYLSGEPFSNDSTYFNGTDPTIYSYPESKERLAIARGARGSILIPDPREHDTRLWDDWVRDFSFEDITLAYAAAAHLSIVIKPSSAAVLFRNSQYSLKQVFLQRSNNAVKSFPLATKLAFKGQFRQREFISSNVIGMIEGGDKKQKDSCVILSAHYDHLGVGPAVKGDSIYNGAVDNAIGVSALLEIAKAFQQAVQKPKRSILFLFVTGEEKGLLGSTFYLDNPVVPHYKTIANINVDGIAVFDTFESIVGVGSEMSTLGDDLVRVCQALHLRVAPVPPQFLNSESFARSDQISFAKAGIPSILLMDGIDYVHLSVQEGLKKQLQWMQSLYHSPFDDLHQPLCWEAACQHTRVIYAFANYLATSSHTVEWKPGTRFINARLQSIAEKR
ncbi:MAG: M20/M25/M40 family metallo-hydrolase [Actinobacteria bacterium]|nr:M20/M25/M40 family metallo-hydrolase [Actinomycetota bacterium]